MAYEGMIAETISINGDKNEPISAYAARPLGPGPFPGVVLIHHAPGWDEFYRETTRKFAHHGYLAISHNLYHRAGEGKADDVAAKVRAEGGVPDAQVIGDTEGAVAWLRNNPTHNGKVGVWGTCSGGRQTFLYACHTKSIDAAVGAHLGGDVVRVALAGALIKIGADREIAVMREPARRLDIEFAPARKMVDEHHARKGAGTRGLRHVGDDRGSLVAADGHVLAGHASVE